MSTGAGVAQQTLGSPCVCVCDWGLRVCVCVSEMGRGALGAQMSVCGQGVFQCVNTRGHACAHVFE